MTIEEIELKKTCGACPEQYDAIVNGDIIGYLRLRHGSFSVEVPWSGGQQVYHAYPKGDGMFEEDEREHYLSQAKREICHYWNNQ